ncbi:MAG: TRAP transporter fused permease subunit [Alphaproteobacteria bacterium]|nr:MAG: TRAP transporter fused permease subunit [Alphaproteobacteria bacterium]
MLLVLVFEAARRGIGWILAAITLVISSYPFVSPWLPGVLHGRGYGLERMVLFLTTGTEGIYGVPIGVAASYIVTFTVFGALLARFGAGDFFFELAVRVTRGVRAASAKAAVIFSALIGMVSGSAAGNVAVTGTLTIPIMKRDGYAPHQAAAIEAVASTGGQIMPPVMGAAAFIMAEILGISYTQVMLTALLPAILFFASAFFVVHLQGVKNGVEASEIGSRDGRSLGRLIWDGAPFIAAFAVLIALMLRGYSPFKAALWGMVALVALDLLRRRRIDRAFLGRLAGGIADGGLGVVTISAACAAAGIIAGTLGVTGLGSKIALLIETASFGSLFLALLFTMIASIVLGMGLPTTAAYLILATVVAPALVRLGVPPLTAHFFVFYYGCISTITPPVALAAYVAGGIAEADVNKTGWTAARYATTSFVLPFAFVFAPALMLAGSLAENATAVATGLAGVFGVAVGVVGCLTRPLGPVPRALALIAGAALLFQGTISALFGAAALAAVVVLSRRVPARAG